MQGEFNGLTSLILRENSSFLYIHCFTHQLKLALVLAIKNHIQIASLFSLIVSLINVVGGSCKHHELLCELHFSEVHKPLSNFEIYSVRGLNQEKTLIQPSDTHWGSHYGMLLSIIIMFSSIVDLLEIIIDDNDYKSSEKMDELLYFQKFSEVSSFCQKHDIDVPNMDDDFVAKGRSHRKALTVTNMDHYIVELFYIVIDTQLQELNNSFNEVNIKLLLCVSFLCPNEDFATFGKYKLISLSQIYSFVYSPVEVFALDNQLKT
ncbi:zinc finger MYM-type protein 1-like [Gossypium australe]|uniref:Zinc finger MYM-type protein 1-like n=1 Tax=Gossypium australe TaxID=47621 RepID=A0A5B6UD83_9ROSI|nr:zinc finger MYM-type protein 1-like [Gossypium australe]